MSLSGSGDSDDIVRPLSSSIFVYESVSLSALASFSSVSYSLPHAVKVEAEEWL